MSGRYACQLVNQRGGTQRPHRISWVLNVWRPRAISSDPPDTGSHYQVRLKVLLDFAMTADTSRCLGTKLLQLLKLSEAPGAANDTLRKNRHDVAGHAGY